MRFQISSLTLLTIFLTGASLNAANFTIDLTANDYEIVKLSDGSHEIKMNDFGSLLIPGKPEVPARTFLIALPPGAEITSVKIMPATPIELPHEYKIKSTKPSLPLDDTEDMVKRALTEWQQNYDATYSSNEPYPNKVGEYLGMGALRKYCFARIAFYPFAYRPESGKLLFYSSITASINYSLPSLGSNRAKETARLLSDTKANKFASNLLYNYSEAKNWYQLNSIENISTETYDYVIVTTDYLESAVSSLVSWKQAIGYSVKVVTTSWIDSNYSGSDQIEKIRNFLIDKYPDSEWGIEYVLLVGDINDIPMRVCTPAKGHKYNYPTDHYYAELTGVWNSDGDELYGECEDFVDLYPEIYVGRIPWSDYYIVYKICAKLCDFETVTGSWKNNALLLGAILYFAREEGHRVKEDGATLMEDIINEILLDGWTYTTMYEKEGLSMSAYSCDYPLNQSNVNNNWSSNDYGLVCYCGHGNWRGVHRKVWAEDDGDRIPETDELSHPVFLYYTDVSSLDDSHPSIIFALSCLNADPENQSIAQKLLRNGSSSIVAATSGAQVHCSNFLGYYFLYYLIAENERVGNALFDAKVYCYDHWSSPIDSYSTVYTFNLYGDPSLIRKAYTLATPTLILPPDFAITNDSRPTFAWSNINGAVSYTLQYALDEAFTQGLQQLSCINDTTITISDSIPDSVYYWRVQAVGIESSPFQQHPFTFTIDTQPPIFFETTVLSDTSFEGPYSITSFVTDNLGVDTVFLYYKLNENQWDSIGMVFVDSLTHKYGAEIPAVSNNTNVRYYVQARDLAANITCDPEEAPDSAYSFIGSWLGITEQLTRVPTVFKLSQNIPNPFAERTSIQYTVAREGPVSLRIYDISGRLVRILVDETKAAGYYKVRWDGKNENGKKVKSGIYFYKLRVDNYTETHKLIMLR